MACPVCFSDAADPVVRESLNAGILVLLGVTAAVLGSFARFFLMLARRSRAVADEPPRAPAARRPLVPLPADPGRG